MSKVKFQFISSTSPKYKELGFKSYEPIEVEEKEFKRIKSCGYKIEVLSLSKPKVQAKKKKAKK